MKKKAWLIILGLILTINNNVYALSEETCSGLLGESTMEDLSNIFKYMKNFRTNTGNCLFNL
ncbi:MAG: hypothetical protein L6V78_01935 [Clostridium sp.]|nr:MAG: hypothetical protein L6V78_01935 [Clostridium sp.]